jgi:CubicO group peptidase (beta-lactamase class C family)
MQSVASILVVSSLVEVISLLGQSAPHSAAETPAPQKIAAPRDVSDLLAPIIAKHDVPALAACVVKDGRVTMLGVAGVRQRDAKEPATTGDLWHLGSCTKAMTATLCAKLVEQGKLKWESSIGEVFPELKDQASKNGWANVTLAQLCTNTSSVPGDLQKDGLWGRLWRYQGTNTGSRGALLEGVLAYTPAQAPGTKFEYSNGGFAIAGHMCEKVTGRSWEELVNAEVLAQIGVTTVGFGAPGVGDEKDKITQPRGHARGGKPVAPGPNADNPPAIGPAGTAHMSITDWAKFAALQVAEGRADALVPEGVKRDLLSAETFKRLHTPPAEIKTSYAYGWGVSTRPWAKGSREGDIGRVLTHSGSNTMWYCVAWLAPEKNLAIVITCNQAERGDKACDEAAGAMIKAMGK